MQRTLREALRCVSTVSEALRCARTQGFGKLGKHSFGEFGLARRSLGEVGGLAQLARAPALQAGGHRFDSDILHRSKRRRVSALVKKRVK